MNMSVNNAHAYFNAVRAERPGISNKEDRININEKKIAKLENEIVLRKDNIRITEELLTSNSEEISILKKLKANNETLVGTYKDQRGLMVEARDLAIEARDAAVKVYDATSKVYDATIKSRDLLQKMIAIGEKMESIMMKNPAKYGGLPSSEVQKLPEVIAAKSQVVAIAAVKVEQYPKEEQVALTETVKNVVDATFTEIKPTDMKANRELFYNLGKRIEAALDKKHETLAVKEQAIKQILNAHYYKPLESFSRMNRLAYLDLAMKDIKA